MDLVNWRLLAHPINWLFVGAILALWAIAYNQVHNAVAQRAADASVIPD